MLKEAEDVPEEIEPSEIEGRRDLRNDLTITIEMQMMLKTWMMP